MEQLLKKMRDAVEDGTANILTLGSAKALKGKRIQTIYFGYAGQDGVDDFIVGEIKKEKYANGEDGEICLFTEDGRNTYIRAYLFNKGVFACSDSDRYVYYVEADA